MGAGEDLAGNLAWDGRAALWAWFECQACVEDQADRDSVGKASPDSRVRAGKYRLQGTVCLVVCRGARMPVWFLCPCVARRETGPRGG